MSEAAFSASSRPLFNVTATGTSCTFSSRRRAVTVTSSFSVTPIGCSSAGFSVLAAAASLWVGLAGATLWATRGAGSVPPSSTSKASNDGGLPAFGRDAAREVMASSLSDPGQGAAVVSRRSVPTWSSLQNRTLVMYHLHSHRGEVKEISMPNAEHGRYEVSRAAWGLLAVLTALNVLNFVDRWLIAGLA